ncbi:leucine-rich repeat-containing protein 40 [Ephemerocybe angulata]|uniref:Leucine-rich repeat-containing protein 40 n=1 Tax=Ephemerocybe angulata TaxID=980116 RepID=A0A8H6LUV7_9AGAR|nr:leucine-rich repeat-containing protein 40 [Tulosesus angulatus]
MSRIPPPSTRTSRSPLKPSTSSTPSKPTRTLTPATPSARTRTTSTLARATTPTRKPRNEEPTSPAKPALSTKERIALMRAEAKKAQGGASSGGGLGDMSTLDEALPANSQQATEEEADLLGRMPLRETIEKARSTGTLNIATRSLPCLPSGLFDIHLGITPDPLKSVENEPKLPAAEEEAPTRRGAKRNAPAWFEAQDLTVIKAWNNDITEIQHEISLFGSLKTVDLHNNKLSALPTTFADLSFLTHLDLSQNRLISLPENLWSLPELTVLNIANNQLTSLPFTAPFHSSSKRAGPNSYASTAFFTPAVVRATAPLPKLINLDASRNQLKSSEIDLDIPSALVKFDLSDNPLGEIDALLQKLGSLPRLKELRFEKAEITPGSISADLFSSFDSPPFKALRILDFSGTAVSLASVQAAFKCLTQELDHSFTLDEPALGTTRILVGKRVIKEQWEIELERRTQQRAQKGSGFRGDWDPEPPAAVAKKAAAIASASELKEEPAHTSPPPTTRAKAHKPLGSRKEVEKEAWEIEAEQGLLTEGGKRRARANDAARGADEQSREASPTNASSISNPQYYNAQTQTLTLPASAPAPKANHNRSFSLASPFALASSSAAPGDLTLPAQTLPLSVIVAQPFADSLRALILTNRRLDRTFAIPALDVIPASGFLHHLEELDLEGCNLEDTVAVQRAQTADDGNTTPPRATEPLLSILAKLFPSLKSLNLSYNRLSNAALSFEALSGIVLGAPNRSGLRALKLRGNRLSELDGFQKVAELFKGNREVAEWRMEELDLRDNEIGRLPAELGLLPLDVFLVEGNVFRVPQRRVWEREGTKGLLSWLRGRIE